MPNQTSSVSELVAGIWVAVGNCAISFLLNQFLHYVFCMAVTLIQAQAEKVKKKFLPYVNREVANYKHRDNLRL